MKNHLHHLHQLHDLARRFRAQGIVNAFLVAALIAGGAGVIALAALPRASRFLPKLRLSPQAMPMH
jgi:hypothetical protein